MLALLYVTGNRGSDYLGHRAVLYGGHGFQLIGLLFGEADGHGFGAFHAFILVIDTLVVKNVGIVVSCNHDFMRRFAWMAKK